MSTTLRTRAVTTTTNAVVERDTTTGSPEVTGWLFFGWASS
ncbi:hypothetical protein [Saccharothrix syringae]|nr:hypothetical protein [Saccharothrix syringae]